MIKNKTTDLVFILVVTALQSCNLLQEDIYENKSPVLSVSVKSKQENKISFNAKASWPNGCGTFSHAVVKKSDLIYYIVVYGRQEKDAVCTTEVIEFDAPVSIKINNPGTYSFRFWQSDSTTLDTTITF